MTGWLIVNEFLNTEKFKELQNLFVSAANKKGVKLIVHTNAEFILCCDSGEILSDCFKEKPEFVIFYDKDIELAKALENRGLRLFNYSDAIAACDSKTKTALYVSEYNDAVSELGQDELVIRMPKTFKVPFTYENIGITDESRFTFLDLVEKELSYPMIFKECFSSFGMGVHLAKKREELIQLICQHGNKECIIQEYVGNVDHNMVARDVRLQMVGEECVAAMMRSNDNDFRANITNGGVMSPYNPTDADISMAVSVMRAVGLDFAGIDIMFDRDGKPVFCEANSNAHFKNLYDLTGVNTAEYMLDYIAMEIQSDDEADVMGQQWNISF